MSERGSFVTEYINCFDCLTVMQKTLLNGASHAETAIQVGEFPIIAGKISGMYHNEEINEFFLTFFDPLHPCHPVRIAVHADSGKSALFVVQPNGYINKIGEFQANMKGFVLVSETEDVSLDCQACGLNFTRKAWVRVIEKSETFCPPCEKKINTPHRALGPTNCFLTPTQVKRLKEHWKDSNLFEDSEDLIVPAKDGFLLRLLKKIKEGAARLTARSP